MKKYLILTAVVVGGFLAGVAAKGYSDGKGWTTPTA
jgi:hypothetical protein